MPATSPQLRPMPTVRRLRVPRPQLAELGLGRERRLEWAGAALALLLQTSAVFPLLLLGSAPGLTEPQKALLRLLSLPVYAITLMLAVRHRRQLFVAARRSAPLLLLMALPLVSVLWSISPSITLRRTIGLDMSMLLSFVLAVRFTPRQLMHLAGGVLGFCMVLSLVFIPILPRLAFMPGESTLRGVFTHKNGLGWMACITVLIAASMLRDGERLPALLIGLPGVICLAMSQSATSMVATLVSFVLIAFYSLLARSRGLGRSLLVVLFLQFVALVLLGLANFLLPILKAMGKDATLTGRVPLWADVDPSIAARPLLGYGYQAFWSPNNPVAWAIWRDLQWQPPHSHNGYRETLLNFGLLGIVLLVVVLVLAILRGARLHCAAPKAGWLWLNVLIGVLMLINLTESNLMVQNDLLWILMTTAIVAIATRRDDAAPMPELPARKRLRRKIRARPAPEGLSHSRFEQDRSLPPSGRR